MSFEGSKGDEVAFTGSKATYGGEDLILTPEVVKGTDTQVVRDERGNAVRNSRRQGIVSTLARDSKNG